MAFLDYFTGGNTKVASRSTSDIYKEGLSLYGGNDEAYRYTFIFRYNTIVKYAKSMREYRVIDLFKSNEIINCTDITIANLTALTPLESLQYYDTHNDFGKKVEKHLRDFDVPEKFISLNNTNLTSHILEYMDGITRIPSHIHDKLIKS
jgi:hypothetical protein